MKNFYPKFLVFLQFGTIGVMLSITHYSLQFGAIGIFLSGVIIGIWAITHNQLDNFNIEPALKENCQLITTGIYRWIRHPMYTSVTLMMLGVTLMDSCITMWILWFFLIIILLLKAKREESLWLDYDPCYHNYKEKTKYFIPYLL